jgi:DNA polymerase III sliding clamp (beta) subunit (PCNA family)
VVIEARSDGRARALESVPVTFTGTSQTISFNPQYLLDGITAAALSGQARPPADGDATVATAAAAGRIKLEFTSPAKPALITWIDGDATPGAGADGQAAADSTDRAGTGAAVNAAEAEVLSAPGRGEGEATDAAPFRYLVVPLRVPAGG